MIDEMVRQLHRPLTVVSRGYPRQVVAYFGHAAVMTARWHRVKEEQEREPGWLQGLA